ncbi:DUF1836 domain-containing protein [Olegusella massiliensis]|uniref:DUF1836 domain-containing protein n=1 Tax=Olegusella massiliensis TaxID=1776381 RepID=UPI0040558565|nr:DUF1836 domain-containing protein [Coriobacteriaceae bacterium]
MSKAEKETRASCQAPLTDFYLPALRDIPDVGLLLEQTCRLINGYLDPLGSVRLTPSMISNYVKQDIIDRPIKKLYYRNHVCDLIFVAIAKTVLQLDDIRSLLELQRAQYTREVAYQSFIELFSAAIKGTESISIDEDSELRQLLCELVSCCANQIHLEQRIRFILDKQSQGESA